MYMETKKKKMKVITLLVEWYIINKKIKWQKLQSVHEAETENLRNGII